MKNFRTYQMALELYRRGENLHLRNPLKDQYQRSLLSVVLNLSEGSAKRSEKDRKNFFTTALGSLREVQTCLEIANQQELLKLADKVGGSIYRLIQNPGPGPAA